MNYRFLLTIVVTSLLAHALLWLAPWPLVQAIAALLIATVLPGVVLVEALLMRDPARPDPLVRGLLALGAGFGCTTVVMLLLSYIPGPLSGWQALVAFDGGVVVGCGWVAVGGRVSSVECQVSSREGRTSGGTDFWPVLIFLLVLTLVGGFLRVGNLGYAEFQGDEVRATLRAAAVLQGYDDVLWLHRKGPVEILVPTAIYALTGELTEAGARLPFAVANVAGLLAIFALGRRLFGAVAGATAALLLALDGYFIAFARIVQYQSIVFLTVVLAVFILHRLTGAAEKTDEQRGTARYLVLAALLVGTGLLAHYEAALVLFPALYLLWRVGRDTGWGALLRGLFPALLVGGGVLALFYVPFVLHPNFGDTFRYLSEGRIGGQFPYNNLADFAQRTTLYSTTYYFALLIGLALLGVSGLYWRGLPPPARRMAIALLLAGTALTLWMPDWGLVGATDWTVAFFGLALLMAIALPRTTPDERTVLLWWGGPLLLALFFTADPRTHVYTAFMGWTLFCGSVVQWWWQWAADSRYRRAVAWAGATAALALTLLFGSYAYWYFVYHDVEILRTWDTNRPAGFPVAYEMPSEEGIFGFPLQNGWKAIGALYDDGTLSGAYLTNAKPHTVNWYTRSVQECARDHRYFFFVDDVNLHERAQRQELRASLQSEYALLGTVQVNGQPRMEVYARDAANAGNDASTPQTWPFAELADHFDRQLAGPDFPIAAPVVEPSVDASVPNRVNVRFGESVRLVGYDLRRDGVQPGDSVELTLYWQSLAPLDADYNVFTQIVDLNSNRMMGQRDGQPGCDGRPTSGWQPGELIVDTYSIPVFPDAAPGTYPLLVGMYGGESGRLPIFNENDEPVGDALTLTEITIEASP